DFAIHELVLARKTEDRARGEIVHEVRRNGRLVRANAARRDLKRRALAADLHIGELELIAQFRGPGDEYLRIDPDHFRTHAIPDRDLALVLDDRVRPDLRHDDLQRIDRLRLARPERARGERAD